MKKTQKLLSLVVVLAFALSMCSISAFAAKQAVSTTIDENIVTATFDGGATDGTANTFYNNAGTATVASQYAGAVDSNALKLTSRTIYNLSTTITAGTYSLAFKVMTPDTNPSAALNIFRFGPAGDFHGYSVVSTVSDGKDTLTAYGVTTTLEPNVWYDMETIIDVDNKRATSYIEGVVVYEGSMKSAAIGRLIDVPVSGRTLYYDDIVFNKITQTYIEDGVTNVMTEDFSSKASITTSTKFYDASGSTAFNKNSDAVSTISVVDGKMQVGTIDAEGNSTAGGRFILNPATNLSEGQYVVSFDFISSVGSPDEGKCNAVIFNAAANVNGAVTGGFSTLLHFPQAGGCHVWENNQSLMEIIPGQTYHYEATFDFSDKSYTTSIDGNVLQKGNFTADNFYRLFNAGSAINFAVTYDNIVINKVTRDYAIEDVTIADGQISARFLSNVTPDATFFVAIKENGVLTSLKAISNYDYFTIKEVGTYSCADADVDVEFYAWASKGLMPVYTYTAQ